MGKIKVRKDVLKQVTGKLQASKNIFSRGDFDEYKIKNMGIAPDGCVYDLDNPTEKFYYDLKMKFAENDKSDDIEKTLFSDNWDDLLKSHKYSRKEYKNGKWIYYYDKHNNYSRIPLCESSPLTFYNDERIDKEYQVALIVDQAIDYIENTWFKDWEKHPEKQICKELRNKKICFEDISYTHLWKQGGSSTSGVTIREPANLLSHLRFLPMAKELFEKGVWTNASYEKLPDIYIDESNGKTVIGNVYQTVTGLNPNQKSKSKYVCATASKRKYSDGTYSDTVYISVSPRKEKELKKSMELKPCSLNSVAANGGQHPYHTRDILTQQNNLSSKNFAKSLKPDYDGENKIGQSFDIQITDITENNKQQKLEQFNKALNAIARNQPFMIKHIPADTSTKYENLTVRLLNFDRSKIEKAVHKVAMSLDSEIKAGSKGETFVYKAQEEISDKFFNELTAKTRAIYNFVISYFDLPDIRIVSKAGELKHKGKILYNPSTGLPIKESDWKKFVSELEKYLNRNYTGIGEKIVLSAESLGIILDRLSKTNSLEAIRKMSLADLKAKRYDVDWISESIKNMKDKFGDVISRERQARIQIAEDSAAQRVTRVKDDIRNNIQQIIIDGIRDKQSKSVVAQNLFDKCASLNRDMQRIADTEVQMATSRAYIKEEVYNTPANEKVYFKRFEMLDDNTCKKCRKINGKIVLWSDVALPNEHIKDEFADIAIWEGKTEGDYPESVLHPWCRGAWIRYYPEV